MSLQDQLKQVESDAKHWPAWKRRECDLPPIEETMDTEDVLRQLMNQGFVIFLGGDSKFCIGKIVTPLDQRTFAEATLTPGPLEYQTYDLALEAAQAYAGMIQPPKPKTMWRVQILYKHRGRGSLLADLEPVVEIDADSAFQTAMQKGEVFIGTFNKGEIEKWEVKVRPLGTVK